MRKSIKMVLGISLFILITLLTRGILYRSLFSYESIGSRKSHSLTHERTLNEIRNETYGKHLGINQAVLIALEITNNNLEFYSTQIAKSPDKLIESG